MKLLRSLLFAAALFFPSVAMAQSGCQWMIFGYVPTVAQWQSCWNQKQDIAVNGLLTRVGNVNYQIQATDRAVGVNATFTAPRTWTLAPATNTSPGQTILLTDVFGGLSAASPMIVTANLGAGNTLNASTNTVALNAPFSWIELMSDGVSDWTIIAIGFGPGILPPPISIANNPVIETIPNESGTGTSLFKVAKLSTTSPGKVQTVAVTDTVNAIGICGANALDTSCGKVGLANIAIVGQTSCAFDGPTTAGDVVGVSTITAGDCSDLGSPANIPTNVQLLGFVYTTNAAAGTYVVDLDPVGVASLLAQQNNKNNPCANAPVAAGTQAAGGTLTIDFSKSCSATFTFGAGNLTINITHLLAGDCGFIAATQDSVGGRTISWNSAFKWAGGTAPIISTGANASDLITFCAPTNAVLSSQLSVKGYQ